MSFKLIYTKQFQKSLHKCVKRGLNIEHLRTVIRILEQEGKLPSKYHPHKLSGNYADYWECHIEPDWLLLWQQDNTHLVLLLVNTGTHSDLF
jgi:mRNA interferase YafQ